VCPGPEVPLSQISGSHQVAPHVEFQMSLLCHQITEDAAAKMTGGTSMANYGYNTVKFCRSGYFPNFFNWVLKISKL
jgi:hypothetical protein